MIPFNIQAKQGNKHHAVLILVCINSSLYVGSLLYMCIYNIYTCITYIAIMLYIVVYILILMLLMLV